MRDEVQGRRRQFSRSCSRDVDSTICKEEATRWNQRRPKATWKRSALARERSTLRMSKSQKTVASPKREKVEVGINPVSKDTSAMSEKKESVDVAARWRYIGQR